MLHHPPRHVDEPLLSEVVESATVMDPVLAEEELLPEDEGPPPASTPRTQWASKVGRFALVQVLPKVLFVVVLILGWNALAARSGSSLVPTAGDIWDEMFRLVQEGVLWGQLWITIQRVLAGFLFSFGLAIVLGVVMGRSKWMHSFLEPAVLLGLTIPGLAWALLAVIWFGIDWKTSAVSVVLTATPLLVLNVYQGTKAIDSELIEMTHVFRFKGVTRFRYLYLPALTPYLLSGARLGLSLGWKVVVLVEVFGLSSGVGYQLNSSFSRYNVAGVFAWTLAFTAVMFVFEYGVMTLLERRLTRWRRTTAV